MNNRSFRITVDYGAAKHELTAGGNNAWVSQKLHETVPPETQQGIREVEFILAEFDDEVEGLETLVLILLADHLRLATPAELRALAPQYGGVPGKEESVLALGAAFFNQPDEYPEEWGWFAERLQVSADGSKDFWLASVMSRGGQLKWLAGTVFLAVRD